MNHSDRVLVIGAGIAGMEASLLLANAGKKVYLVEKLPLIGGNVIKNEESFPNLECSTCMVAPLQQDVLQNPNIEVMTLSTVEKVEGEVANFTITVNKKARYVSLTACIGCGACYDPCPVTLKNEWEENLSEKKAIYVPCPGSLPNVPAIDPEHCLQLTGKQKCSACVDACMFGAIDFSDKDKKVELHVGAIIVATGFELFDPSPLSNLGYGKFPGVYTSMEFERLFASNGPTSGEIVLRDGKSSPQSVAIIHCVGRGEQGYCSGVCCMSSFKYAHFLKHRLPDAKVYNFYSDICVPDKTYQKFFEKIKGEEAEFVFQSSPENITVSKNNDRLSITYEKEKGTKETLSLDMVILACALVPGKETYQLGEILGVELDDKGFFLTSKFQIGSVETSRPGIFVAGCAEGPKDIQNSVVQAEAAAGKVMNCLQEIPADALQE